ncbi:MAG TPA: sulfotransferase [Pirellulaceae bacterium]|nr:sulfotransferase [Pirellulaceae bacterium]
MATCELRANEVRKAAGRRPNLFVVGAMKAGSTSLHEYLHQHPQIYMSRFKEPQYFAPHRTRFGLWGQGNPLPEPGIDWYLRLFADAGDAKYAGETSVSYTARHWVPGCEERIWNFNRDARIIYLMRDPVERAISHYWHFVAAGRENLPPREAMERRDDYVARSDYAYQIEPYLARFGADRVFLVTVEELDAAPRETFNKLFRWLDVRVDVPIDVDERHNTSERVIRQSRRLARPLVLFLRGWRWACWKQRFPGWVTRMLEAAAFRTVDRARVNLKPTIEYLRKRLLPTVPALAELAGREFPEWTTLYQDGPNLGALTTNSCQNLAVARYDSHIDCLW